MTFKHKLSKRLALMRDVALLLSGAAILACAPGDRTVGPGQPTFLSTISQLGAVTDLSVTTMTDTSVTLAFTELDDGTGLPASYDVRYAVAPLSWGSAASVGRGTCAIPVAGSAIGAKHSCTILGLAAGTGYEFQLVAFRWLLETPSTRFGDLSNVASGRTAQRPAPVATVTVSPASASVAVGSAQSFTTTLKNAVGDTLTGRTVIWATSSPTVATVSASGFVTGVAAGKATITATSEGRSDMATIAVTAPVTKPGTVSDLAVSEVTDTSVTLAFTEVSDGAGLSASYDIRYAVAPLSWSLAASVGRGSCVTPVAGKAIGVKRTCTVLGLAVATSYQFQVVAFRGLLDTPSTVFGGLSNVASGATALTSAPVSTGAVSP